MLDQYNRVKREHQDSVLFFRLGDFYEMFAADALEVSSLLNLTLTQRNGLPMCGIPCHACRGYIARLLRFGKKIAICEQLTGPGKAKLIDRKVVEIITPGTTVDEDFLEKGSSNYLASLAPGGRFLSFAYIDLSTGDFYATSFPRENAAARLGLELERLEIREMIAAESPLKDFPDLAAKLGGRPALVLNRWADWLFDPGRSLEKLKKQFGTANLKGYGLVENSPEITAAGALLDYLDETAKTLLPHVKRLKVYGESEFVGIDEASQRNLEIARNLRDGTERYSLFETLDETKTSMGRRLLKRRILHPLKDLDLIRRRLDMVESFYRDQEKLAAFRGLLAKTPDLERLSSRLAMEKAHGKDMIAIKNALDSLENLRETVLKTSIFFGLFESSEASSFTGEDFLELEKTRNLLERGLRENPSILLTEGNLIREGYDSGLDQLRDTKNRGRELLEHYLEEERRLTGIPSLKIRYNRLIGYFFEVTAAQLSRIPPYFIRRQGLAGGERFSTEKLARLESDINGASDRIIELEKRLFLELRGKVKEHLDRIAAAARIIAELDAAQSLAWAATIRGWIRPEVDGENRIAITEGRHPVVEAQLPGGEFIPNDLFLDGGGIYFALITGPNMAGKSTYLRQAALIVIMAQAGSFVPAREAAIGVTDRIYCRVGASDNLAQGESTFLVEMNETAHILHTATERSLVIMDEVGRGTGTTDGLAIAWAVCEDLLDRLKCKTLFATHYHELSQLENPGLANRSMEALEKDGQIVFLRKLREGPSAESYGIHVAALAGLPPPVVERARALLEGIRGAEQGFPALKDRAVPETPGRDQAAPPAPLRELAALDPNNISPLEALKTIHRWKELLIRDRGREVHRPKTGAAGGDPAARRKGEDKTPSLFDP
ncbi:MAG: DNA mismatch repair protein MutS [Treponema sp.]|jgi:DNA mismatch repair protein MutS|nr:DNA mismatch repair protein MutS [Treponema sp.]